MTQPVEFQGTLDRGGEGGAWVILRVPFSVEERFGRRGRLPVKGTLNGHPYRSSLFPGGDGTHHMMVNKTLQKDAKAGPGDRVAVTMEPDDQPRTIEVPDDLRRALDRSAGLRRAFDALPPSRRKLMVESVTGAKKPETRAARVRKVVEELRGRPRGSAGG